MKKPLFVVIDTSVLISALISPSGASRAIVDLFLQKRAFVWMLSKPLYEEYLLKIARKIPEMERHAAANGYTVDLNWIDDLLKQIVADSAWFDTAEIIAMTDDKNDDHIGTMAVEAGADYLITLDKDFNPMKGRYTVQVMAPRDFIHILRLAT